MQEQDKKEQGFTLIELLVAIVVVGILTAVAIVGIGGLTDKGNASACLTTQDASKAASAVFFANSTDNTYPQTFADLTGATPPLLEHPASVTEGATTLDGKGWTVTMVPGATDKDQTTFTAVKTNGDDC